MKLIILDHGKMQFNMNVDNDTDIVVSMNAPRPVEARKTEPIESAPASPPALPLFSADEDRGEAEELLAYRPPSSFDVPMGLTYPELINYLQNKPHVFRGGLDDPRNLPEGTQYVFEITDVPPFRVRCQLFAYLVGDKKYATLGAVFDEYAHPVLLKLKSKQRRSAYEHLSKIPDLSDWKPKTKLRDEDELDRCGPAATGWIFNKHFLAKPGRGKTSTPLVAYYRMDPDELFVGVVVHYRTPAAILINRGYTRGELPDTWYYYQMKRGDGALSMPKPTEAHPKPWTGRTLHALLLRANAYFLGCRSAAGGSRSRKKRNHEEQLTLPNVKDPKDPKETK